MQTNTKNNIEDIYELTPMQQGMLFHTVYNEDSDAYIEQFCYNLSGNLDMELFKKAWKKVVERHGVLRTSFQWKGISKPVQIVNKTVELKWENLDWSNLTEEQQQIEFKKFIKQDRRSGFIMEKAPLMRCTLIKLNDESYEFVWTFHHILMDGWSYPVLQKEVFTIYEGLKENKILNLPDPKTYKQFILWLNQQNKNSAEDYWRKELKGFDSPGSIRSYESGIINEIGSDEINNSGINLSAQLTSELQKFAKENQITLNTIIQGAWAYVLSTYRGENDVLFGGVISGRNPSLKGIESMVGLFINTLPVRVNIDYGKEIISWLKELQENNVERDQYSYCSLVDIQKYSEIPRGTQLFDNIIVFENYPLDKSLENGIAGIKINNLRAFERTSFPLTVLISPGESLGIHIAYETAKFDEKIIQQILSNFKTAIENIISSPSGKLSELSVLTEEERNKILIDWNKTRHEFPKNKCVHQLIEEQFSVNPDAVAVEFEDIKLTYRELNERANQIANYLQNSGVKPNDIIGICIERSIEMVTALLGIIKSGAAYLPIDPGFPIERIVFLIEDTKAQFILTQQKILEKLPATNSRYIPVDKNNKEINRESKSSPLNKATPSDLAYVIYTSGSTGKPKGVLMKHEALVNLLYWQLEGQNFAKSYRTLQFTTLSFDVSFQEIFSTWYSGGTLVMMSESDRQDLSRVLSIIKYKNVQRIFLAFIALQGLAEIFSAGKEERLELKEVITAGEQLQNTPAIINLFNHLNGFIFSNHYGPSEAHVVTSYELPGNTKDWVKLPPIGKPIFNTQMYILNSRMQPVPPGVTGDLYIGGVCLVKGYLNRPQLTAEKFVDNPFYAEDNNTSKKIYKTGDNARYLHDGNIEYLGRTDNQIKLRGYRIELGEIESVLAENKKIKNSMVVARDINGGDKRLIAYIISQDGKEIHIPELKNYLKDRLPVYMIPSDFIFINEIPLTSTGKIDQRSLPELVIPRINKNNKYIEPKDSLELQLVKIWEKVLGINHIGIRDNFFELGGHSLLALRVFGYIEKLTGRKLALSTLFSSPTIEELAKILKDKGWTPPWKSLVAVKPGGSKLPFFCVPPGAGTALHFQSLIKYIPNDQPFYVLESLGLDGIEQPHTNVEEMAEFYVKEIQSLQPEGPYLLGGRCFGGRVVYEMAQQLVNLGQKVALLAIFDTWPPYTAPRPVRILEERDLKHFVTRTFHHLKTGELWTVTKKYSYSKFLKIKWRIQNKLEYIFSNKKKRLYKEIMLMHFNAQDKYLAKKYPGKITLIECATFKSEYREAWRNLALGGFETYVVPDTNHKTIIKEPRLKYFAEKLNFILEKTHNELNNKFSTNGSVSQNLKENSGVIQS